MVEAGVGTTGVSAYICLDTVRAKRIKSAIRYLITDDADLSPEQGMNYLPFKQGHREVVLRSI